MSNKTPEQIFADAQAVLLSLACYPFISLDNSLIKEKMRILQEHTRGDRFLRYKTGQRPLVGDVIETDCDGRVSIRSIEGIRFKTGLGELSPEGIRASSLVRRGKAKYNDGYPMSDGDTVKYQTEPWNISDKSNPDRVRITSKGRVLHVFGADIELIATSPVKSKFPPSFLLELQQLINKHSKENDSNTPDYILADYLSGCLENFAKAMKVRDDHNTKDNRND